MTHVSETGRTHQEVAEEATVNLDQDPGDRRAATNASSAAARAQFGSDEGRPVDGATPGRRFAERVCGDALASATEVDSPAAGLLVARWRALVHSVAALLADDGGAALASRASAQLAKAAARAQARHQAVCVDAVQMSNAIDASAPDAAAQLEDVAAQAKPWLDANRAADSDQLLAIIAAKQASINAAVDAGAVHKPPAQAKRKGRGRTTRTTEVAAAKTSRASLDDVVANAPTIADVPAEIELPPELVKGLQEAWDESFPDGHAREQAGILVRTPEGKVEWRRAPAGERGSARVNYGDFRDGDSLLAAAHTHPYDEADGGHADTAFSGGDLSRLVAVPERVHVVQSGKTVFMVVKTAEFDAMLEGIDDEKRNELEIQIQQCWDRVYYTAKGSVPERAETAAKVTCKRFHLGLYRGTGSKVAIA
jgi:hypothetical protein